MKSEVQELVREGVSILWDSYKLEGFVMRFSEIVFNFQERVDDVLLYTTQIDTLVLSLETCEYRVAVFKDVLDQIQKLIDDLNLRSYSNLPAWVTEIDLQVSIGAPVLTQTCMLDSTFWIFPGMGLGLWFGPVLVGPSLGL